MDIAPTDREGRSGRSCIIIHHGLGDDLVRRHEDGVEKAREEEWRREYMTLEMKYQEKYEEGFAEGYAETEHNTRVENAQKMIAIGMDHKLIAEISGLPLEEVEALAQPQPV